MHCVRPRRVRVVGVFDRAYLIDHVRANQWRLGVEFERGLIAGERRLSLVDI
jgi:hypothetical protein